MLAVAGLPAGWGAGDGGPASVGWLAPQPARTPAAAAAAMIARQWLMAGPLTSIPDSQTPVAGRRLDPRPGGGMARPAAFPFRDPVVISWRGEPTAAEQTDGRHGLDDLLGDVGARGRDRIRQPGPGLPGHRRAARGRRGGRRRDPGRARQPVPAGERRPRAVPGHRRA